MVQLSHYAWWLEKNIAFNVWTFVSKVMSLLCNTLSKFVIAFVPRSKYLWILWLQSLSRVILEPKKIKSVTSSTLFLDNYCFILLYCLIPSAFLEWLTSLVETIWEIWCSLTKETKLWLCVFTSCSQFFYILNEVVLMYLEALYTCKLAFQEATHLDFKQ